MRSTPLRFGVLNLVLTGSIAAASSLSGQLSETPGGAPAGGRIVSATRLSAVGTTDPDAPIAVEWNATADANGDYVLTIPDGLPGLDQVLLFTRSVLHFNQLWGGVETSANIPRRRDVDQAGVVMVDGRINQAGLDFALASSRQDALVRMRDGVTSLATTVWRPARHGSWPAILIRTTYNKDGLVPGVMDAFLPHDFVVVTQDTRGRYASQGVWTPFRDDGWGQHQDGYDSIEWTAAQSWCDGHVGTYGGSALGIVQYMAAGADPPHLDAAWVIAATPDAYRQMVFQGGSYRKELVDGWLDSQGGSYMKDEYKQHPNEDAYWAEQNLLTRLDRVTTPIYHVGGWYDIFTDGSLQAFSALQTQGGIGARWNQKLRVGPWTHGTFGLNVAGQAVYPINAIDNDPQVVDLLRWFDFWLKGIDTGIMDEPPVRSYTMGPQGLFQLAIGNAWRLSSSWPPAATRTRYYLQPGRALSTSPPSSAGGSDPYSYDPHAPVPTVGGPNLTVAAGPYDQSAVEARADVISFTTPALTSALEVTGNIQFHLFAASTGTDTDWTVKLVDVYPNGRPLSVIDGVLRARHRLAFDSEQLIVPGQVYEYVIDVWSTSLVFAAGHRIRVELSSSNDTRFDPNPNTGHPFRADTQTQVVTNTIFHDALRASYLELPLVDGATVAGCATIAAVTGLRVERAGSDRLRLHWDPHGAPACFAEYRLFGSDDPSSWAWFVRHPLDRTTLNESTIEGNYGFYLVIAAGTDGANGPHWPTP